MRLLVIGASGFIGLPIINHIASSYKNIELHAVYYETVPSIHKNIIWHQTNIFDRASLTRLFEGIKPTYLVQLAWCTDPGTYWKDHRNLQWLIVNLEIAQLFVKNGGQRSLFIGTSAEYDWSNNDPLDEYNSLLKPNSLYGATKLGLYWTLSSFFEQEGISWVWARLFNPFGANESPKRLIPRVCWKLLLNEPLHFDAGSEERDFLHVEDVGYAIAKILFSKATGPINVASGIPITIRDVVSLIANTMHKEALVSFDPVSTDADIKDIVVANIIRLKNECDWYPLKTFEQRIHETCVWWTKIYEKTKKNEEY